MKLMMKETEIHSLDELRKNFKLPQVTAAFADGSLAKWLEECYYEREAAEVRKLAEEQGLVKRESLFALPTLFFDSKEEMTEGGNREYIPSPAVELTLCRILGVDLSAQEELDPERKAAYERRRAILLRHTNDPELLSRTAETATNQVELAELLNTGCRTIYLCDGSFTVPIRKAGIHYIGIDHPVMETPFTEEQYKKAGITFSGIELPHDPAPNSLAAAEEAARANGYDDFPEKHNALATAFHREMKAGKISHYYHLDDNGGEAASESYKSRFAAEQAVRRVIDRVYDQANSFFAPDQDSCIAAETARRYAGFLSGARRLADRLNAVCGPAFGQNKQLERLADLIENAEQNLLARFREELRESGDYYRMYEKNYFIEQVTIEEDDYTVDLFDSELMNGLARLIHNDVEYSVLDLLQSVSEMNDDVNTRAETFFTEAHRLYRDYCEEIEALAEEIGAGLSADDLAKLHLPMTE